MKLPKSQIDYFCSDSLRQNLKAKAVRGGLVTGVAQGARVVISIASIPILTRLLDPADFGLVAMVTVFTGLAAMFVDSGLSMATVQRPDITRQQATNLFWMSALLGLLVATIVSALAPLISWMYGEPRLIAITRALSLSFVFSGLALQAQALMRRGMQFTGLAATSIAALVAGQLTAIAWAWRYHGQPNAYWALVLLPIVAAGTNMLGVWLQCHWHPGLPRRNVGTRELALFGANLTGFSFVNYFARNADNFLIGLWWGRVPLGYYERAYKLFLYPLQAVNAPLSGVMIPSLSRLADNRQRYEAVYLRVVQMLLIFVSPGILAMAVAADWWIPFIMSEKWADAAPIFRWLAVVGLVQTLGNTSGWLFISQGKSKELFTVGVISSLLTVGSFLVGLPWGPTGVAAAYALGGLGVTFPLLVVWMHRSDIMDWRKFTRPFLMASPVWMLTFLANLILVMFYQPSTAGMGVLCSVIATAVGWTIAVLISPPLRQFLLQTLSLTNTFQLHKVGRPTKNQQ